MPVRIILAEDHRVVRQGLRSLLEAENDLEIVGEAGDGLEAVDQIRRLKPDVAIVDLMMPGIGGLEVTRQIKDELPRTRIVILSMYANKAYVTEAMRLGASAYVVKESSADKLVHAVRQAVLGRRYLSPPLSESEIEEFARKTKTSVSLDPYETLTAREREIFHLAAEGRTTLEIARRLRISSRTVETHRANLMRKVQLHSQTELVQEAIRRGIIQVE